MEYMTASEQPTPKRKPRKQPIAADQRVVVMGQI
jgi:hypothetical protein